MNAGLNVWGLLAILPQTLTLALFPLWIYRALQGQARTRLFVMLGLLIGAFMFTCAGLTVFGYAAVLSPGYPETLGDRWTWTFIDLLVLLAFFAALVAGPVLARYNAGTLGYWLFAQATLLYGFLFGAGAVPTEPPFAPRALTSAIVFAVLVGDLIAVVIMRADHGHSWRDLLLWNAGGLIAATVGIIAGTVRGPVAAAYATEPLVVNTPEALITLATALAIGLAALAINAVVMGLVGRRAFWTLGRIALVAPLWFSGSGPLGPQLLKPVKTFSAQNTAVRQIMFSPDNSLLVTVLGSDFDYDPAAESRVVVWRVAGWSQVTTLPAGHFAPSASFSPDGKLLAVTVRDSAILIYATATWTQVATIPAPGELINIAFAPDNVTLAAADRDSIWRWRRGDWAALNHFKVDEIYAGAATAFAPDGGLLATGGADWKIRLWRVDSGALVQTIKGHDQEITSLAYAPDGAKIVSTSWDNTVRVWRVADGRQLYSFKFDTREVAFAPDSSAVVASSSYAGPSVWRLADGVRVLRLVDKNNSASGPNSGASVFSPDGHLIASGSYSGQVFIWKID